MSTTEVPGSQNSPSASLKRSWKFLAQEKLPRIDVGTTFKDAYSQLSRCGSSGFLLSDKGELRGYVKAGELAAVVVQQANANPQQLREYSAEPIGEVINKFPGFLVPVVAAPVNATEAQLYEFNETVFSVVDQDGTSGWYLNHETVRETATQKTVFICTQGHKNPDSDHGTCYSCPYPIVRTETK